MNSGVRRHINQYGLEKGRESVRLLNYLDRFLYGSLLGLLLSLILAYWYHIEVNTGIAVTIGSGILVLLAGESFADLLRFFIRWF